MASALLEQDAVFRSSMLELDQLAAGKCGRSVVEYLYDPDRDFADRCDDLVLTNLGIVMVECSLARLLDSRGIRPTLIVGSSLGELAAVAVASCLAVREVLDFVCDFSNQIIRAMSPGGMLAVLTSVERFRRAVRPNSDIAIASVNNNEHFVISADVASLARARRAMTAQGIPYQVLPVNFAFHSCAVDVMATQMRDMGMHLDVPDGCPPIYSSRTMSRLTSISGETCQQVIRGPIHFTETVASIPGYQRYRYVDLSPSSSLAAILRSSMSGLNCFNVITPFNAEMKNLARLSPLESVPA
ncbi:MAG: acyltransferase domain-containing protein [Pseudonocardiaceae bacterium]|nr:acyltransferase domain-containing protein [Pseudonocardiaceae bacterium]